MHLLMLYLVGLLTQLFNLIYLLLVQFFFFCETQKNSNKMENEKWRDPKPEK